MPDKLHYEKLLKHCLEQGLTIWADCKLQKEKQTTGHWNGAGHISVFRDDQKQVSLIPGRSSDEKIRAFIEGSPNVCREMAVLLHEYGHWYYKHPHASLVADKVEAYQHEVDAWNKGEELGRSLGMMDFSIFYADRDAALKTYRDGFGL